MWYNLPEDEEMFVFGDAESAFWCRNRSFGGRRIFDSAGTGWTVLPYRSGAGRKNPRRYI